MVFLSFWGGVLFIIGHDALIEVAQTETWPSTEGVVLEATVEAESVQTGEINSTSFYPHVVYHYTVAERQQTGDRITWNNDLSFQSTLQAKEVLADYPVNQAVTVYYNPQNPGQAVLRRGGGESMEILRGLGIIVLAAGALFLCLFSRSLLLWWRASHR